MHARDIAGEAPNEFAREERLQRFSHAIPGSNPRSFTASGKGALA
jgi:hypothetical protein